MKWLQRLLYGRYGPDSLSLALLWISVILSLVGTLTRFWPLSVVALILLLICFFRIFSKNIAKRQRENARFLRLWGPVMLWFKRRKARVAQGKTHRFFKCPGCKQTLRVPKGKGKILLTCPKCGERFERKS